jgi:hypothetical protein
MGVDLLQDQAMHYLGEVLRVSTLRTALYDVNHRRCSIRGAPRRNSFNADIV